MNIICAGDSHLHSVTAAYRRRQESGNPGFSLTSFQTNDAPYAPITRIEGGKVIISPQFDAAFREALAEQRPAAVFLYRGGGEVAQTYTNGLRPFDFCLPWQDASTLDTRREIVPFDLVFDYCRWQVGHMRESLRHVRSVTKLPVYQIALPPITPSEDYILAQAKGARRDELQQTGIAPAQFRCKVWRLLVLATHDLCVTEGVNVVEPPGATLDESGCLLQQFWGDGIHANTEYGTILLDRIVEVARQHELGDRK
jgi:hypothetical protein